MSVLNCIAKLSQIKQLSKKTEQEILDFLQNDQQLDLASATFSQQMAGLNRLAQKKADARVQAVRQTLATAKVEDFVFSHPKGQDAGWQKTLENTFTRATSNQHEWSARLGRWIDELGPKWLGFGENLPAQEDALRLLSGGQALGNDPASRGFAGAITDVMEYVRKQFIEAGSPIAKRADWGRPQIWKNDAIKTLTLDQFKAAVMPRLDVARMYKPNGSRMTPGDINLLMEATHEAAITNGASRITPGSQGQRSLANQWLDSRVYAFTPEGFIEHNRQFGEPNVIKLIIKDLDAKAHDLAMMQNLGPNPEFTKRYITDLIRVKTGAAAAAEGASKWMWNVISGVTNEGMDSPIARWSQAFKNIMSSALLPSAAIRSFSGDLATTASVAQLRGMSTPRILGIYKTMLKQGALERGFAARLLASSEMFLSELHAANRMGDFTVDGFTGKLTDKLFRLSTMTPATHALKAATSMDFLQMLALNVGKPLDDLPAEIRGMFKEYGFEPAHWDVLRRAPVISGAGDLQHVRGLDLMNLPQLTDAELKTFHMKRDGVNDVFRRTIDMMTETVNTLAVPTPNLRTRAYMTLGTQADSVLGQGWRMAMLFKSFPLTYMLNHLEAGMAQQGIGRALYFGKLGAYTTVAGVIGNQMIDILKGNDPEDMFTAKFWGKAFLSGGGLGLYSDFLQAGLVGQNRYGHGFVTTLGGPMAGFLDDTASLLLGTGFSAIRGDEVNYEHRGGKAVNMLRTYSPKLFYTRLAMDRLIWDQLQQMVNSDAPRSWARQQRKMMEETNKESWWQSGDLTPSRAPALGIE